MFSSYGTFRQVDCPVGDACGLLNCIFRHDLDAAQRAWLNMPNAEPIPPTKKAKTGHGFDEGAERERKGVAQQPFVGTLLPAKATQNAPELDVSDGEIENALEDGHGKGVKSLIASTQRPISPPPLARNRPSSENAIKAPGKPAKQESLNPRVLSSPPATHSARLLYLQKLHEEMARLNNEARKSEDADAKTVTLSDGELITLALDEEEKIARENANVYANVIKMRMVAYKKMPLEQWTVVRLEALAKAMSEGGNPNCGPDSKTIPNDRPLDTGLATTDELQILSHLVADQSGLDKYGFVTSPPNEEEIKTAQEGTDVAHGWEQCERCKTRFQVFPERREDGALTTGGKCTYHHGRIVAPTKDMLGEKVKKYSCCNEPLGSSAGCTVAECHVFKVYDAKRLASIMQFERTPENPDADAERAVCFDCEMGFTALGMELIRVTALAWPSGEELLDVLVQPLGTVLDLNSRYSGVQPEDFLNAQPYDHSASYSGAGGHLRKVESPVAARKLLFDLISPSTRLIGHAIENDLNAMRIVHPCIIDTVILFPHAAGLPRRLPLKWLAKTYLWRDIQMGGAQGHDSKEDAKATGDLVRLKVGRKWKEMQRNGWTLREGMFHAPAEGANTTTGAKQNGHSGAGKKRPREGVDDLVDYE